MRRRTVKAKTLAWLLAAGIIFLLLPGETARAASHTYYMDYGSIAISQNAGDASKLDIAYSSETGAQTDTIDASDEIVITQNGSMVENRTITVSSGAANITLERANISNGSYIIPFSISPGAAVHLTLSGANRLYRYDAFDLNSAIFRVPEGAAVTIDKKTSDALDSLTISCEMSGFSTGGAAIGGNSWQSCGTVTINGGTVSATSESGAGIGGGGNGSGGNITINGGTVTAISTRNGAGIGGGMNGDGGTVTINGGTVSATSESGAGIGGGENGNGGTVTITGGKVTATGGAGAADIGGGAGATDHQGTLIIDIPLPDVISDAGYGGSITGSGPYTVTATDGYVIDSLKVDGVLVSAATGQESYEVTDAEKSVIATFAYTVNFPEPAHGTLTVASADGDLASGQIIRGGQVLTITAEPDAGYVLESLTVNGEDVTADYNEGYIYTVGTKGSYRSLSAGKDTGTQGAEIAVRFVSLPAVVSVAAPAAVTGVRNGTAKTAAALGLPATVMLATDHGNVQAAVTWDVASSVYDPDSTAAQTFTVNGVVAMPSGVINTNGVSLNISVTVSVLAAAVPAHTPTVAPAATAAPSASPAATGAPAQTASPGDGHAILPETIEQDEETGEIVVDIDVDELPDGAAAIRLPGGEVVAINDAVNGTIRLEIHENALNQDGQLVITILDDEQTVLGSYNVPVRDDAGRISTPAAVNLHNNNTGWLWVFAGVGALVLGLFAAYILSVVRRRYAGRERAGGNSADNFRRRRRNNVHRRRMRKRRGHDHDRPRHRDG